MDSSTMIDHRDRLPFHNVDHCHYTTGANRDSSRKHSSSNSTTQTQNMAPGRPSGRNRVGLLSCFISRHSYVTLLCLVLSLLHGANGQTNTDILILNIRTSHQQFINGQTYTILCQLTVASSLVPGAANPLSWERVGDPIPSSWSIVPNQLDINPSIQYESRLTLTTTPNDNDRSIKCKAQLGIYTGEKTYSPNVIIVPADPVVTGPTEVPAGVDNTWTCVSDGASFSKPNVYFRDANGFSLANQIIDQATDITIVPNNNRVYKVTHRMTMSLPATDPVYVLECFVIHDASTYTSTRTQEYPVSVLFPPQVTKANGDLITGTEGTTITLSCIVVANPNAESITWTKNGVPVTLSSRVNGSTTAIPSLIFNNLNRDDAGSYICSATNQQEGTGSFSSPTNLTVRYAPRISYTTTTFNAGLGGSVTLPCPVVSVPDPTTIRWKRIVNGVGSTIRIDQDARLTGGNPVTKDYGLTINPVEKNDEIGEYYCEADNDVGTGAGARLTLVVNERPVVDTPVRDVVATENAQFTLLCDVIQLSTVTELYWTQNGLRVTTTSDPTKYVGGTRFTSDLTVFRATDSDAGTYRCVVSNPYGTTFSDSVVVTLNYRPRLTVTNLPVSVQIGAAIFLSCSVSANPAISSLYWTKNGATLSFSSSSSTRYSGGTISNPSLIISDATVADQGLYVCVATNDVGVTFSNIVDVSVTGAPLITVTPATATVEEGVAFHTIACQIVASPAVTNLYWTRNGDVISSASQGSKYIGGTLTVPNLTIRSVERQDAGDYQCVATNSQGTGLSSSSQLNVIYKPTITIFSSLDLTRQVGTSVTLQCSVTANPGLTDLYWLRNGVVLITTNSGKYSGGTLAVPSLTIFSLEAQADTAQYACVAENSRGTTVSQSVQLTVTSKPIMSTPPSQIDATESQSFVLPCEATPLDSLTLVRWRKDGVFLDYSSGAKYSGGTTTTPSLTVLNAIDSDQGTYECVATNDNGDSTAGSTRVFLDYTPRITVPAGPITRRTGVDVLLSCVINARPTEDLVFWTQDGGTQISSDTDAFKYGGGVLGNPSLVIYNTAMQDNGNYRCHARNNVSTGVSDALLVNIEGNPVVTVSPSNPVVNEGDRDLIFTCSYQANPEPLELYWTKDGSRLPDDPAKYSGGNLDSPNLTIKTIEPSDRGDYRCIVRNRDGLGDETPVVLTVNYKPIVRVPATAISSSPGSDVTLSCQVDSNPAATDVYWTKAGVGRIDAASNPTKYRNGNAGTPSLLILDSTVPDSGEYSCVGVNERGNTISDPVDVFVNGLPIVTVDPLTTTVDETLQVTIPCTYLSVPDATAVTWSQDGNDINVAGQPNLYQGSTLGQPSLTIIRAEAGDRGGYVCSVQNDLGTGRSLTFTLVLRFAPIIAPSSGSVNRPIGSAVTLTCDVEANPTPTDLYWVKAGRQGRITADDVTYSGGTPDSPNLLILNSVTSDTGNYSCVVVNSMGQTTSAPTILSIVGVPRVTAVGPATSVLEGQTVILTCTYESVPEAKEVFWTKDSGRLDVSGQPGKYSGSTVQTPSLTITNLASTDLGDYLCYVTNDIDTGASNSVALDVSYSPILTVTDTPITNGPGNQVILTCIVDANPEATQVYWRLEGQQLSSATSPDKYAFGNLGNPNLVIRDAAMSDTGTYYCVAVNGAGTTESDPVSVSITSVPIISTTTPSITVEEKTSQVTLPCTYEAVPEASEIFWEHDGSRVVIGGQGSRYSGSTVASPSLVISEVAKSDAGSYICNVVNTLGTGSGRPISLDITYAPVLTVATEPVDQSPGSLLTLTCGVDANPEVSVVTWSKVGKGQISSAAEPAVYVGGNRDNPNLGIISPQTADSGIYTCTASNSIGSTTSDSVTVNIISIPVVTATPVANDVIEGQSVTLTCTYLAVPDALEVFWTKGGAKVDVSGQPDKYTGSTFATASLTIVTLEASDLGTYLCNVRNRIGSGSSEAIRLNVLYHPILTVTNTPINQRPGNDLILLCTVDSNPEVTDVYWFKVGPGRIVAASNPNKYSGGDTSNPNLQIKNTTSGDTGIYFCAATNGVGTTNSSDVTLTIVNVPSVTATTLTPIVQVGTTNVLLECEYQANPPAESLHWTKGGATIDSNSQPELFAGGNLDNPSLTLRTIGRASDGLYVCNVDNDLGTGASNALDVDVTFRPTITLPNGPVTGSPSSSVTLNILVEANPQSTEIYWTKLGQGRIDSTANPSKYSGGNIDQPSLTIRNTDLSDTASYQVTVVNGIGTVTSEAVSVSIQNIPVVTVSPSTPTVSENTANVIFTCSYQANPTPTRVFWTKDGTELDTTSDRYDGGRLGVPSLTIKTVVKEDAGTYVCNVVNRIGTGVNQGIVLSVLYAPDLTVSDVPINGSPGSSLSLVCQVNANPIPTQVYWTKVGQGPISSTFSPDKYIGGNETQPSLQILDATIDDSGNYSCVAVNSEGLTQSPQVVVNVINTPSVTATASATTVDEGANNVVFTCIYRANPCATEIYWTLDDTRIQPGSTPDTCVAGASQESRLVIGSVSRSNRGSYVCHVVNTVGTGTSSAIVFDVLFSPTLTTANGTVVGAKGVSITLTCGVAANPEVTSFYWTKDDVQIDLAQPAGKYSGGTTDNTDLTINDLNENSDVASYVCFAVNPKGSTNSLPVHLRVTFDPVVTTAATVTGVENQALTITCTVQMFPEANLIVWFKGTDQINVAGSGNKYSGGNPTTPSLTITSAQKSDGGQYRCQASNGQSPAVSSGNTQVLITYPPKITNTSPVEALIGGEAIIACIVDAQPVASNTQWNFVGSDGNTVLLNTNDPRYRGGTATTPSLTITNLQVSDAGQYTCIVTNGQGTSTSTPVVFGVRYGPRSTVLTSNSVNLNSNDALTLTCTSDGFPAPSLQILRNGVVISTTNTFSTVAASQDNTQFSCVAGNIYGDNTATLNVNVNYAPESTVNGIQDVLSPIDQTVTLTCDVTANPSSMTYAWYKGTTLLNGQTSRTLSILLSADSDFGSYKCTASNVQGTTDPAVSFALTKNNVPFVPSNVEVTSSSSSVTSGSAFTLTCQADGFPAPTYVWRRGNEVVSSTNTYTRTSQPSDNGDFRCTATNSEGSASKSLTMNVRYAPVPNRDDVVAVIGSVNSLVTLTCDVSANPAVSQYRWFQGANEIPGQSGSTYTTTVSDTITDYTCSATNDQGSTNPAGRFTVNTGPAVGASTGDDGLSTTTIILIVVVIIIVLIILILLIIFCLQGKCSRKKEKSRVSPAVQPKPMPYVGYMNGNGYFGPVVTPDSKEKLNVDDDENKYLTPTNIGAGPIISLPEKQGPRAHHLPPLNNDETPTVENYYRDEKRRSRKKKRRRRQAQNDTSTLTNNTETARPENHYETDTIFDDRNIYENV